MIRKIEEMTTLEEISRYQAYTKIQAARLELRKQTLITLVVEEINKLTGSKEAKDMQEGAAIQIGTALKLNTAHHSLLALTPIGIVESIKCLGCNVCQEKSLPEEYLENHHLDTTEKLRDAVARYKITESMIDEIYSLLCD